MGFHHTSSIAHSTVCTVMAALTSSVWSARSEKRHDAIARDRDVVLARLDSIELAISQILARLDDTFNQAQQLTLRPEGVQGDCPSVKVVSELQGRIERMELLLFHTSLDQFAVLDDEIKQVLPQLRDKRSLEAPSQPDCEPSPSKALGGMYGLIGQPPGLVAQEFGDSLRVKLDFERHVGASVCQPSTLEQEGCFSGYHSNVFGLSRCSSSTGGRSFSRRFGFRSAGGRWV